MIYKRNMFIFIKNKVRLFSDLYKQIRLYRPDKVRPINELPPSVGNRQRHRKIEK
jgi:hypothetical protein